MSTETALTSNDLAKLAIRINTAHEQVGRSLKAGLGHALEAGRLLLQAKAATPHGAWLPWLQAQCRVSPRTAQAYMRLARRLNGANPQRVAHLSFREALHVLAAELPRGRGMTALVAAQRILVVAVESDDHDTALGHVRHATALLEEAMTEIENLQDRGEKLRLYALVISLAQEAQNLCAEMTLRTQRKAGELLAQVPEDVRQAFYQWCFETAPSPQRSGCDA